jgi:hypothetical protein
MQPKSRNPHALNWIGTLPVQLPTQPLSSITLRINSRNFCPSSESSSTVSSPKSGSVPQARKITARVLSSDVQSLTRWRDEISAELHLHRVLGLPKCGSKFVRLQ